MNKTRQDGFYQHNSTYKKGWVAALVQWVLAFVKSEDFTQVDYQVIEAKEEVMGL